MKITEGFVLKNIADTNVVVPLGSKTVDFQAVITLNETGAFLWSKLESDCTEDGLVDALLKEYAVDRETAAADVKEFILKLSEANLLA